MHELYELKEKLCRELKEFGEKEMTAGSLDVIDKLSHAIKNLNKIIEKYEEEGYSEDNYRRNRRNNRNRRSYANDYSMNDNMVSELNELMSEAPDERMKQEFKRFIQRLESM